MSRFRFARCSFGRFKATLLHQLSVFEKQNKAKKKKNPSRLKTG